MYGCVCTCRHTHTVRHPHAHAHMHTHTHSETPTCTRTHTHTQWDTHMHTHTCRHTHTCTQACIIVISVQRGKNGSWGKIKWCYGSTCQVGLAPPDSWTANCHATARGDHSPQSTFCSSAPSFEKQDRTQIPRACSSCTPSSVCKQEPSSGPWNNAARTAVGQHGDFLKSTAFIQTIQLFTVLINSSRPEMYTAQGHKLPLTRWQSETKLNQKKEKKNKSEVFIITHLPSMIYCDRTWFRPAGQNRSALDLIWCLTLI